MRILLAILITAAPFAATAGTAPVRKPSIGSCYDAGDGTGRLICCDANGCVLTF